MSSEEKQTLCRLYQSSTALAQLGAIVTDSLERFMASQGKQLFELKIPNLSLKSNYFICTKVPFLNAGGNVVGLIPTNCKYPPKMLPSNLKRKGAEWHPLFVFFFCLYGNLQRYSISRWRARKSAFMKSPPLNL
jgi:hypothetical protein